MLNKISPLALAITGVLAAGMMHLPAHSKTTAYEYAKDSIIIKYKAGTSKFQRDFARRLVRGTIVDTNNDGIDDKYSKLLDGRLAKLTLSKDTDIMAAIKQLNSNPAVEYAEPDYIVKANGMPDDPHYVNMWGLHNDGQEGGTLDADIDAPEAWDVTTGSDDIIIGVIDTGVNYNHPDLVDNMWVNPGEIAGNGIDDDGNGVIDDIHGFSGYSDDGDPMDNANHGTHVAGTIGAQGNNGTGVTGVSWDVSIIGCAFLGPNGYGDTSDAIECINYMTDLKLNHGIDIRATNNSWGGAGFSQALEDAINSAGDAGILFIAAAGNSGSDNDVSPHYPSSYETDYVMAVASTDRNDELSIYPNPGQASSYGLTSVDMGAPGSNILSTISDDHGYAYASGTSMATPHITGAAALVWSMFPEVSISQIKNLLMNSGDYLPALDGKTVSANRLNAAKALHEAEYGFMLTTSDTEKTISVGESTSFTFNVEALALWSGDVNLSYSVSPELAGITLSDSNVSTGGSFTVDVATTEDTLVNSYTITVTASNGTVEKTQNVILNAYPADLKDYDYSNNNVVDIPDNDADGITSTIEIADDLQIYGINAHVDISHTWRGDLRVSLTSPSGTEVVLHDKKGGSADDLNMSYSLTDFNTEMALGTWTLSVSDLGIGDEGTLNNWGLTISGSGEAAPAAPVAQFGYNADSLTLTFSNSSYDVNEDIASYNWDFGDGAMSTDENPVHTYAEPGTYDVTLTVTDAEGHQGTSSMAIDVFDRNIEATVKHSRISRRGTATVDLQWSGAEGDMINIYRNGELYKTTANDGRHRDRFRNAEGDYEYKICETDTSLCSDPFTVSF